MNITTESWVKEIIRKDIYNMKAFIKNSEQSKLTPGQNTGYFVVMDGGVAKGGLLDTSICSVSYTGEFILWRFTEHTLKICVLFYMYAILQ